MRLKVINLLALILLGCNMIAQNIVPNPSFELYSTCPNDYGQIAYATSWDVPPNSAGTSPDHFNSCSTIPNFSVPTNIRGYQSAYHGNGYVGVGTYFNGNTYREYIQTQLISPMVAGQLYYVSFQISLSEQMRFASNNMGAVFTVQPLAGNTFLQINITPHILNQNIITDNVGWTLISGTYQAIGNEQYITIGNFFNDASTQVSVTNPQGQYASFYYIDSVYVSPTPLQNNEFYTQIITVAPNPITNQFTIATNQNEIITSLELYSLYGKVKVFNIGDNIFDISDLSTGIYYLAITFESNKKEIIKISKL